MSTIIIVRGGAPIDVRLNIAANQHLGEMARGKFAYLTMETDHEAIFAECDRLSRFTEDRGMEFVLILVGGVEGGFKTVAEVRPIAEIAFKNEWEFSVLDNKEEPDIENIYDMILELQDQYGGRDQYQYLGGSAFDPDGPRTPIIPNNTQSQEG